jgi:hypothetical protein
MKRFVLFVFAVLLTTVSMNAQIHPHALGARLGGDGDINGVEVTYQHGMNKVNRLEFNLGFGGNDYHNKMLVTGTYQWVWNLDGGLNWYAGPGAAITFHSYDSHKQDKNHDDGISIGIGGQIGLEYDFTKKNAPVLLSLDARPMWDFIGDDGGLGWGLALGVKYIW